MILRRINSGLAGVLVGFMRLYQVTLSPVFTALGVQCRFHPSCSAYAIAVIKRDGPWRGTARAFLRLLRCQPWHPGGFDPP